MRADGDRWVEVTPSSYTHERAGLAYVRDHLPDTDPYRAWSNLELVTDQGRPRRPPPPPPPPPRGRPRPPPAASTPGGRSCCAPCAEGRAGAGPPAGRWERTCSPPAPTTAAPTGRTTWRRTPGSRTTGAASASTTWAGPPARTRRRPSCGRPSASTGS